MYRSALIFALTNAMDRSRRPPWFVDRFALFVAAAFLTGCPDVSLSPGDAGDEGALRAIAPRDLIVEATGALTTVDLGEPAARGGEGEPQIAHDAPPAGFPLGETIVIWTVTDEVAASDTDAQRVTVQDTTSPILTRPPDVQIESTGPLTSVSLGMAQATDLVDPNPSISHDAPLAGFPVGATRVNWLARDTSGNEAIEVQTVTVLGEMNGDPLVLIPPGDVQAEATGPNTIALLGSPNVSGGTAPVQVANDSPAEGFPVGLQVVTWTATDAASMMVSGQQAVLIEDTTPPSLVPEADRTVMSEGTLTPVVLGSPTVSDLVDPTPSVVNDAPAAGFPLGTTIVTWTATDASANTRTVTQSVTVEEEASIACSTLEAEFANEVYPVLDMSENCGSCHTPPNFVTTANGFNLEGNDAAAFDLFKAISRIMVGENSIVPVKALGDAGHGGGNRFPALGSADPDYEILASMAERLTTCLDDPPTASPLLRGTDLEQLHKITRTLVSRPPSAGEIAAVEAASTPEAMSFAIDGIVDDLLDEEAFYDRLKELYNDLLLTNKKENESFTVANAFAVDLFANRDYFESYSQPLRGELRSYANRGLARAPVELVEYVVRNDRPFSEVLTAEYTMVNPYSATIYDADVEDPSFRFDANPDPNQHDPDEFRPATNLRHEDGTLVPSAGIISSHAFLDRYRTTNTNVNRARSRWFFYFFLGIDIEGLAPRDGLDLNNVLGSVPTYEDPQCTVCHDVMDPVAGLFKNRRSGGEYRLETNWQHLRRTNGVPRMLPPGYTAEISDEMPISQDATSLQWLASRTVADERFAMQTVRTVFRGLTRIDASDPETTAFLNQLREDFVANGMFLKPIVKSIVQSDFLLARNLMPTASPADATDFGTARLATPEELERWLSAVAGNGYIWSGPNTGESLTGENYRLLYGGIDSDGQTIRAESGNALIVGIQDRIANQFACEQVVDGLAGNGPLFPFASGTDIPDGATGTDRIRENIRFLHFRLLGEDVPAGDPEIEATYQLFLDVRDLGETAIPSDCRGASGNSRDDEGTVLPWMAVLTYLISDFHFAYH